MHGVILDFNKDTDKGLISGSDEKRYTFTSKDWKSNKTGPNEGIKVDFEETEKRAENIYCTNSSPKPTTNIIFEIVFGVLLFIYTPINTFYLSEYGFFGSIPMNDFFLNVYSIISINTGYDITSGANIIGITLVLFWYLALLVIWGTGRILNSRK